MIVDNTVSLLITLSAHSDAAPAASPQQWTQETIVSRDAPTREPLCYTGYTNEAQETDSTSGSLDIRTLKSEEYE